MSGIAYVRQKIIFSVSAPWHFVPSERVRLMLEYGYDIIRP